MTFEELSNYARRSAKKSKTNRDGELLGLHYSLSKLWETLIKKRSEQEIATEMSNCIMGVMTVANTLNIDLEHYMLQRINERERVNV
jgi:hypothetical protein